MQASTPRSIDISKCAYLLRIVKKTFKLLLPMFLVLCEVVGLLLSSYLLKGKDGACLVLAVWAVAYTS